MGDMSTARSAPPVPSVIDTDFKRSLLHSIALFRGVEPDESSPGIVRRRRVVDQAITTGRLSPATRA